MTRARIDIPQAPVATFCHRHDIRKVAMKDVLSAEQSAHYDALRGDTAEVASPPHTGHQHRPH